MVIDLPNELLRELLLTYADYQYNLLNLLLTNSIFSLLLTRNDINLIIFKYCKLVSNKYQHFYKLPDNRLHGTYIDMYLSNQIKRKEHYYKGKKIGEHILYNLDGCVINRTNYSNTGKLISSKYYQN